MHLIELPSQLSNIKLHKFCQILKLNPAGVSAIVTIISAFRKRLKLLKKHRRKNTARDDETTCLVESVRQAQREKAGTTQRNIISPFPTVSDRTGLSGAVSSSVDHALARERERGANERELEGARRWLLAQRTLKRMGCGRRCHEQA